MSWRGSPPFILCLCEFESTSTLSYQFGVMSAAQRQLFGQDPHGSLVKFEEISKFFVVFVVECLLPFIHPQEAAVLK